jgi:hypothetical protein
MTTLLHSSPSDPLEPFTVKLHEETFRSYKTDVPELEVQVTKQELLDMYKQMTTMRRMEMAADALYKAKMIRGFCHLAIGQVGAGFVRVTNFLFIGWVLCDRKLWQLGWSVGSRRTIGLSLRTGVIRLR